MRRHEVEEGQLEIDIGADGVALVGGEVIPLVHRQHHGAAALGDEAHELGIVHAHFVGGVGHHDDDVGLFDCLQGFDDGELLDHFADAIAAADTGGVDQLVFAAVALNAHADGVARGASHFAGEQACIAQQAVDQRGLARVGAADDGDADDAVEVFKLGGRRVGENAALQVAEAIAVLGRDRNGLAQAKLVKVGTDGGFGAALGLVHQQRDRLVELAQALGDGEIVRHAAIMRIDQKQDVRGLQQRDLRLLFGQHGEGIVLVRREAAGIDHHEALALELALTVLAVAGQARQIHHQRVAAVGEGIEQC